MVRCAVVAAMGLVMASAAVGQTVTVCQGTTSCVEVDGNLTRQLSPDELRWKNLSDARVAIGNINCSVASDPDHCSELVAALYETFR